MKSCYIYSYTKEVEVKEKGNQQQNHLVIFFPYKDVIQNKADIQIQLRDYFHNHTLPDRVIVICLDSNKEDIRDFFDNESEVYDYIPKFEIDLDAGNISIIALRYDGTFDAVIGNTPSEDEINELYKRGLTKIFVKNGGLIVSQTANHFVFPSGKHSNRFLRTGNVLINGSEIYFIATGLVRYFKREKFDTLYSDTSSINSLAFAYINLMKELSTNFKESVKVESFGSYSMFEKLKFSAKRGTLFLISSSTSGSILKRMTDIQNRSNNIELSNVCILYGLNVKAPYNNQVLCDLTFDSDNPDSLEAIESYNIKKGEVCEFCKSGSKPLKVEGDVFLLEKPIVTTHLIKKTDLPMYLRNFSSYYRKGAKESEPIVRCYHKENGYRDKKYEIYIDLSKILEQWHQKDDRRHPYHPIFLKVEKYILQNVPASLKYMIVLPDEGSSRLAKIISSVLNDHGFSFKEEQILGIKSSDFKKIDKSVKGSIAIVSSSIVTGRNLLYLSRALRDYEDTYQRIYFNFINRTANKRHLEFLQSNLGLGEFGVNTHKIFNIEEIHCVSEAQNTPWHVEEDYAKKFQEFFEKFSGFAAAEKYFDSRVRELAECGMSKGLSDNLFFPSIKGKVLRLRNGFAFAPQASGSGHTQFINQSKQSEIYFIISSLLNDLRNKGIFHQSEYVRNLLDPGNFVRYNDGVIQACILRACTAEELNYSLSEEASLKMKAVLGDMILHIDDDHAEALNEFFYAISLKKLKLTRGVIEDCIKLLQEQKVYIENDSILKGIIKFIEENVLVTEAVIDSFKNLARPEIKD